MRLRVLLLRHNQEGATEKRIPTRARAADAKIGAQQSSSRSIYTSGGDTQMKENLMIVLFLFFAFTCAELVVSSSVIVAGIAKLKSMLSVPLSTALRSNQTLFGALNGEYGAAVARNAKLALEAYKFSVQTTGKTTLGLACTEPATSATTVDVLQAVASSASGSGVVYIDKNCDKAFTSDVDQGTAGGQLTPELIASQSFVQVTMKTSDTQLTAALVPVSMALAGNAPPANIPFPFSRALAPIFIAPVALPAETFEGEETINHAVYDDDQTIVKEIDFDCQIAQTTTLDARFAQSSADDGNGGLCTPCFPDSFPQVYFRGRLWFDNNNDGFIQPHERPVGPDDLDNTISLAFAVRVNNEFVVVKSVDFGSDGIYEATLTTSEITQLPTNGISLIVLAAIPRADRDGKYVPLPTLCGNTNSAGFVSARSLGNMDQFPYLASTADLPGALAQDTSQTIIAELIIANSDNDVYARTARINFGFACRATVDSAPSTVISLQVDECGPEQLADTTTQIVDKFRLQISAAAAGAWRNARIIIASANRSTTDGTLVDTEEFAGFGTLINVVADDGTVVSNKSQPYAAATKRILTTSDITQQQPTTRSTDLVFTITVTSRPSQNGCFGIGGASLVNEVALSLLSVPFEQFYIGQFGASCVHKQAAVCIDTDGQGPTTTPTPTTAPGTGGTIAIIAIFMLVVLAICGLCLVVTTNN